MYPMRMKAGDIQSRVMMSRLLLKMEERPEISRKVGLEDISIYPDCSDTEKDTKPADTVSAEKERITC